ncbi:hypothetical protein GCM10009304_19200 [Pseudomonas matsuisoli]|uniref:Uncharacterized protein n=1 Tax=Pseudomonas matsuisoli TaxID=1515666 RepID=A0A917PV70_9PSED|nr:hypothetical protein GCM10009304_19200 [Pseudomonas matsuisoli]
MGTASLPDRWEVDKYRAPTSRIVGEQQSTRRLRDRFARVARSHRHPHVHQPEGAGNAREVPHSTTKLEKHHRPTALPCSPDRCRNTALEGHASTETDMCINPWERAMPAR